MAKTDDKADKADKNGKNGSAPQLSAKQLKAYVEPFRFDGSREFHLQSQKPGEKGDLDKDSAIAIIDANRQRLRELQEKLYAHDRWSVLLIFQGMDAAGKDSAVEHVMSGINPQGCQVFSFKQPTSKELDHDFMWRSLICLPERGRIGIFNRSYYEELLIVRVHPEILAQEKIPPELVTNKIWQERFEDISAFERYMARNGTLILKFFLNLSKDEQRKRFLKRIDDPDKNWKFSEADIEERQYWDKYMLAYEDCLSATTSEIAPWYIVPADDKKNARLIVSQIILKTFKALKMSYPETDEARREELQGIRQQLVEES